MCCALLGPPGPLGLHGLDGLKGVKGDMGSRGMGLPDTLTQWNSYSTPISSLTPPAALNPPRGLTNRTLPLVLCQLEFVSHFSREILVSILDLPSSV